jgi:hypothetical protein
MSRLLHLLWIDKFNVSLVLPAHMLSGAVHTLALHRVVTLCF